MVPVESIFLPGRDPSNAERPACRKIAAAVIQRPYSLTIIRHQSEAGNCLGWFFYPNRGDPLTGQPKIPAVIVRRAIVLKYILTVCKIIILFIHCRRERSDASLQKCGSWPELSLGNPILIRVGRG
jgi:hypothetical protein